MRESDDRKPKSARRSRRPGSLLAQLAAIDGVEEGESAFKEGRGLWVNGKEIAHFDEDDVIDIRLTAALIRSRRAELREVPSVTLRRSASADWLEVHVRGAEDEQLVVELVTEAAAAHAAPPGTNAEHPATGVRLARMRRFH
ncbi:MAG: luciferase family protein [Acidimicrobiales bacterium]